MQRVVFVSHPHRHLIQTRKTTKSQKTSTKSYHLLLPLHYLLLQRLHLPLFNMEIPFSLHLPTAHFHSFIHYAHQPQSRHTFTPHNNITHSILLFFLHPNLLFTHTTHHLPPHLLFCLLHNNYPSSTTARASLLQYYQKEDKKNVTSLLLWNQICFQLFQQQHLLPILCRPCITRTRSLLLNVSEQKHCHPVSILFHIITLFF